MMTVEGRELPQPHNPLKEQLIRRHTLFPVPPSLYCSWGFSLSLGSSSPLGSQPLQQHSFAVSELLAISWACHFWLCSLLSLWHSLSIPPTQPNLTGPPHSAQLPRPNSLGPTLLARPNSTRSAQLTRPNSTRSAQLTRPNSTRSAQLTRPSSLIPTRLYGGRLGPFHCQFVNFQRVTFPNNYFFKQQLFQTVTFTNMSVPYLMQYFY